MDNFIFWRDVNASWSIYYYHFCHFWSDALHCTTILMQVLWLRHFCKSFRTGLTALAWERPPNKSKLVIWKIENLLLWSIPSLECNFHLSTQTVEKCAVGFLWTWRKASWSIIISFCTLKWCPSSVFSLHNHQEREIVSMRKIIIIIT